jgi:hypothetical protein
VLLIQVELAFFGSPAQLGVVTASNVYVGRQLQLAGVAKPCVAEGVSIATRRR